MSIEEAWLSVVEAGQAASLRRDPTFQSHGTLRRNAVQIAALLPDWQARVDSLWMRYAASVQDPAGVVDGDVTLFASDAAALVAALGQVS